jgi:hypothetical protein
VNRLRDLRRAAFAACGFLSALVVMLSGGVPVLLVQASIARSSGVSATSTYEYDTPASVVAPPDVASPVGSTGNTPTANTRTEPKRSRPVPRTVPGVVRLVSGFGRAAKEEMRAVSAGRTAARACSFSGATTVLMSDGSHKPIEAVRVGDEVIATDPKSGERVAKRVEHVWVHDDTVVDLIVNGAVITTTEDHPFWSITDQRFERADQLTKGEVLLGASGRRVTVSGLRLRSARASLAYNLSVEGIHTYHVGDAAVLVHNSCYSSIDALNDPKAVEGLTPSQVDDLARNAGLEVLPGKASATNPATRYYVPGTNRSVGFRVLPGGVAGQSGIKAGPYLRYFGGPRAGQRVPLK